MKKRLLSGLLAAVLVLGLAPAALAAAPAEDEAAQVLGRPGYHGGRFRREPGAGARRHTGGIYQNGGGRLHQPRRSGRYGPGQTVSGRAPNLLGRPLDQGGGGPWDWCRET